MATTVGSSVEALRNGSMELVNAAIANGHIAPNKHGAICLEAPGGLEIVRYRHSLHLTGEFVSFVGERALTTGYDVAFIDDRPEPVEFESATEWASGRTEYKTVPKREWDKVAGDLLTLLTSPEE